MSSGASTPNASLDSTFLPQVGAVVELNGGRGIVRYAGTTSFAPGLWVGVELEEPKGKNDGSVQGKRYFQCLMGHGVFVRPSQVRKPGGNTEEMETQSNAQSTPSTRNRPISAPPPRSVTPASRTIPIRTSSASTRPSPSPTTATSRPISAPIGSAIANNRTTPSVSRRVKSPSGPPSPKLRNVVSPVPRVMSPPNVTQKRLFRSHSATSTSSEAQEEVQMHGSAAAKPRQTVTMNSAADVKVDTLENRESVNNEVDESNIAQEESHHDQGHDVESEHIARIESSIQHNKIGTISSQEQLPATPIVHSEVTNNITQHAPALVTQTAASPSKFNQLVPLRDVEDLRIKVKHLELKRTEDREKLMELERLRTELDSTLVMKNKLGERLSEVQTEVKDVRRQLREALDDKDRMEAQLAETQETMEMMLLDKEMAEEKADSLQAEVHALEEKVEELSLDLEVLKQENELGNSSEDNLESTYSESRPNINFTQLERQNERLKEALVKLRDITSEQESALREKIITMEQELMEYSEYKSQYERLSEQLGTAEITIEELKGMIDDSLGAEDIVEALTEKNMILNEKLEEAKAAIQDLEALKELNDELEQDHIETEKLLQEEIDVKDRLLAESTRRISTQEEALADYERTVHQFRELVRNLQSDLDRLRNNDGMDSERKQHNLSSQTQAMVNLNLQLQSTTLKAQARAIDLELRRLDVEQATQQLEMIKPYLPDTFFNAEFDTLLCVLLFRRLIFKSDLLGGRLVEMVGQTMDSAVMDLDRRAFLWRLREKLTTLSGLAGQFTAYVEGCSVDQYVAFGQMYSELAGTERRLDSLVELVKKDEIKGAHVIDDLHKLTLRLERIVESQSAGSKGPVVFQMRQRLLSRKVGELIVRSERIGANLDLIDACFQTGNADDGALTDSLVAHKEATLVLWDDLRKTNGKVKGMSSKLSRRLKEMENQGWTLEAAAVKDILEVNNHETKALDCSDAVVQQVTSYIQECREGKKEVTELLLQRASRDAAERIFATSEDMFGSAIHKALNQVLDVLVRIDKVMDNEDAWEKVGRTTPPWLIRASRVKADYTINADMQKQIESLNEEAKGLIREIKVKDLTLQESAVKIELLEKRMNSVRKHAETISRLEESLAKTSEKSKVYEEAVESLHADLEQLEKENEKLKKALKRYERQGQSVSSIVSPRSSRTDRGGSDLDLSPRKGEETYRREAVDAIYDGDLLAQYESLRAAVRFLRAENTRLKAERATAAAAALFSPNDPLMRRGKARSTVALSAESHGFTNDVDNRANEKTPAPPEDTHALSRVKQAARQLARQVSLIAASPRVIDLTRMPPATNRKWWSWRDDPRVQKWDEEEKGRHLLTRGMALRAQIQQTVRSRSASLEVQVRSQQMPFLGRIRVRTKDAADAGQRKCVVLRNRNEFEAVHAVFVA